VNTHLKTQVSSPVRYGVQLTTSHIGGQVTQTAYQKVSQYINGYAQKKRKKVQKAVRHLQ